MSLYKGEQLISEMRVGKTIITEFSLQEKSVTPTTSPQVVTPDSTHDGLSKVNVDAIPTNYVDKSNTGDATTSDVVSGKTFTSSPAGVAVPGTHVCPTLTDLLPAMTNPASAEQIVSGYQGINQNGQVVTGNLVPNKTVYGTMSFTYSGGTDKSVTIPGIDTITNGFIVGYIQTAVTTNYMVYMKVENGVVTSRYGSQTRQEGSVSGNVLNPPWFFTEDGSPYYYAFS